MQRFLLRAKLHRATITEADLNYEGSLTIDQQLMEEAGIVPFEQVHVYNISNGARFETYAIADPAGSGVIGLNGAAARKGQVGDLIIIACYCLLDESELKDYHPHILLLDEHNSIAQKLSR